MAKKKNNPTFEEFYTQYYPEELARLQQFQKVDKSQVNLGLETNSLDELFQKNDGQAYYLDLASVMAALYLPIKSNDTVLDMCAAPGGKSLTMLKLGQLQPEGLTVNEFSKNRFFRLKKNLHTFTGHDSIRATNYPAEKIGMYQPNAYNKILLDAPCSGELHIMNDEKELDKWSPKRSKRLSSLQYSLLCSALLSLKVNGQILYSTCAINNNENDDVIEKLLTKKKDITIDSEGIEDYVKSFHPKGIIPFYKLTKYGVLILPSNELNIGPLYFTRLRKIKDTNLN